MLLVVAVALLCSSSFAQSKKEIRKYVVTSGAQDLSFEEFNNYAVQNLTINGEKQTNSWIACGSSQGTSFKYLHDLNDGDIDFRKSAECVQVVKCIRRLNKYQEVVLTADLVQGVITKVQLPEACTL